MNASPALSPSPTMRPATPIETIPVPAKWRLGQIISIALVVLFAVYYNMVGWKAVGDGEQARKLLSDQFGFAVLIGIIWLCTPTAAVIATSTLHEALRRRWIVGFLGFAMVATIGLAFSAHNVQLGEEERFLEDFGTGLITGMTLLIAIFLGVAMVPPEIERRTILAILSKPVNRVEFMLGKFLGLCLTLLFSLVLLGAFFLLTFALFSLKKNGMSGAWVGDTAGAGHAALGLSLAQITKAFVLHFGQLIILAALALMLSLWVTPLTAITFCFLAFLGGSQSSYWGHLGGSDEHDHDHEDEGGAHGMSKPMQNMVRIVYYALPRLDQFDVRSKLVTDTIISVPFIWKAWSAGLVYVAVMLLISYLIFSDREF